MSFRISQTVQPICLALLSDFTCRLHAIIFRSVFYFTDVSEPSHIFETLGQFLFYRRVRTVTRHHVVDGNNTGIPLDKAQDGSESLLERSIYHLIRGDGFYLPSCHHRSLLHCHCLHQPSECNLDTLFQFSSFTTTHIANPRCSVCSEGRNRVGVIVDYQPLYSAIIFIIIPLQKN